MYRRLFGQYSDHLFNIFANNARGRILLIYTDFVENFVFTKMSNQIEESQQQSPDSTENHQCNDDGDFVDPWTVTSSSQSGPDYDKLIGLFCFFLFFFYSTFHYFNHKISSFWFCKGYR